MDTPLKQCNKCKEWKPATPQHFHRKASSRDGLRSICITCRGCTKMPDYSASEGHKRCRSCLTEKPATTEFFYRSKSNRDGLNSWCKYCMDERKATWDAENAERREESSRAYRETNREAIREYQQNWVLKNADRLRQYRKEKRAANIDHVRQDRLVNADRYRAWMRAWRQRNKGREREYYEQNKDKARIRSRTYETRKMNLPSAFTENDWQRALEYFSGCCAVCGRPPGLFHTLAMDHWIPISSPDCPGTIPANIIPLCHGIDGCNNSKNRNDPVIWLTKTFSKRRAKEILTNIANYFSSLNAS